MVYKVPLFILIASVVLVVLNVFLVCFHASLTSTFEVRTIIFFLQMKKLRHEEGLTCSRSFSHILMELESDF